MAASPAVARVEPDLPIGANSGAGAGAVPLGLCAPDTVRRYRLWSAGIGCAGAVGQTWDHGYAVSTSFAWMAVLSQQLGLSHVRSGFPRPDASTCDDLSQRTCGQDPLVNEQRGWTKPNRVAP